MAPKSQEIKQKIIATIVIVFMFVMAFSTLDYRKIIAAGSNVQMSQTVSAGSLTLSVDGTITFGSAITVGTAVNSGSNIEIVNVFDLRGSGAGWGAVINSSDFFTSGGIITANFIASSTTYIFPGNGTLAAWNSASLTGVARGTVNGNLTASKTLVNASTNNGMGGYHLENTLLNIVYNGNGAQVVGTYYATSSITVS